MRPQHLKIEGFTSYREPAEVDFTDLDLFAITGPTGAGKSSLIDAMTFALFGKAPRVGSEIKDCIAQGMDRMSVDFEFTVGEARYRVFRRTTRKGSTPQVQLAQFDDGDWRPIADRVLRSREEAPIPGEASGEVSVEEVELLALGQEEIRMRSEHMVEPGRTRARRADSEEGGEQAASDARFPGAEPSHLGDRSGCATAPSCERKIGARDPRAAMGPGSSRTLQRPSLDWTLCRTRSRPAMPSASSQATSSSSTTR